MEDEIHSTEAANNKKRPMTSRVADVGKRFAAVQDAIGISSEEARVMDGASHGTWSNWRSGRRKIDPLQIETYCRHFEIPLDYIFYGDRARLPHSIATKIPESLD